MAISNEKVKDLDEKIKQLQAQKQQLLARVKEDERRKNTKRLIEIGAAMDSIGIDTLEKATAFKESLKTNIEFKIFFNSILAKSKNPMEDFDSK